MFSSSGGDGHNCHEICQALASEPREISPTRFSNSVHNAVRRLLEHRDRRDAWPRRCSAPYDGSFCAGLLEALAQVSVDREPVLLVAYDTEYPEPLHAKRPVPDAFGVALVLTPNRDERSAARLEAALEGGRADILPDSRLEALRRSIPAARALPLIRQLALGDPGRVVLEYLDVWNLAVDVAPCR